MFWGSEGSKSRLAKAAGRHVSTSKLWKTARFGESTFGSTIGSQNVEKHTIFAPLLKVELLKKCTLLWRETDFEVKPVKELSGSELFWIEMSKKCTLLWREAHLKVKMVKAHHSCSTFGSCAVENVHAIVAGSTFRSQNC